jgi:hypothetical protein
VIPRSITVSAEMRNVRRIVALVKLANKTNTGPKKNNVNGK